MAKEEAPDIRSLLWSSASVRSLESERAIIAVIEKLGWSTSHAAYYADPISGKTREIDVVARACWRRQHQVGELRACLNLVFEAKSNAGYHLVFAPTEVKRIAMHEHWIGFDDTTRKAVLKGLETIGVRSEQLRTLDTEIRHAASPNDGPVLIHNLRAKAPPAPFYASAYRETNVGNEKELENSVLWRAGQALNSVVRSYKTHIFGHEMGDMTAFTAEAIKAGDSPMDEALKWITGFLRDYYMFHPILVIDSPMWAVKGKEFEPLQWCRFIQTELGGTYEWWFDVVHSASLETYMSELAQHYRNFYGAT